MKIEIEKIGTTLIMRIIPSKDDDAHFFDNFAREGQLLTAEVKGPGRYRHAWLEIRKQIL